MPAQQNDLTLEDVLRDPMILAVRRADRVDADAFETLLRTTARRLKPDVGHEAAAPLSSKQPREACGARMPAFICRRMTDARRSQDIGRGVSRAW